MLSLVIHFFLHKPLEVREAGIKPTDYKVCVLGLWGAQEEAGKRFLKLADALESGRWVRKHHFLLEIPRFRLVASTNVCRLSSLQAGVSRHRRLGPGVYGCSSRGRVRGAAVQEQPGEGKEKCFLNVSPSPGQACGCSVLRGRFKP